MNWRYGDERSILMTELWAPILQDPMAGSVLYGDIRLMGDDHENNEFNIGLGYREIIDAGLLGRGVAGGHVWFDRRLTARGSSFNQITTGAEWFGDVWDLKLNGYIPLNDDERFTQTNPFGTNGAGFAGSRIVVNTDQSVVEESLAGVDLEIGWRAGFLDDFTDSTRIYAGGYHFEGDRAEDVSGWRTRITSDITPDIQLGARFQDDDARGSQGFLEATIRFPFGNKQSYRSSGLYARLDESPERDIDIVSGEAITDDGLNKPLLNSTTGAVQRVVHVDNTAGGGGDGTVDNPFNTLAGAAGAAGPNDLIYIHRGDGMNTGQNAGIAMNKTGQMLVGSGSALNFSGGRFTTSNGNAISGNTIIAADPAGAPVIGNGGGNGVTITADDTYLSGFNVTMPTGNGIDIANANNVTLENITVSGAGNIGLDGLWTDNRSHSLNISNFTGTMSGTHGSLLEVQNNSGLSLTGSDLTFTQNMDYGIRITTRNASNLAANIDRATFSQNGDAGVEAGAFIYFQSTGEGTVDMSNVTAVNNFSRGVWLAALNSSPSGFIASVSDSTFINNANAGLVGEAQGDALVTFNFSDNMAYTEMAGTQANGIYIANYFDFGGATPNTSVVTANILNNSLYSNGEGLRLQPGSTASILNATVNNNIFHSNTGNAGIYAQNTGANGTLNLSASGNQIYNNAANGVFMNDESGTQWNVDFGGGSLGSTGGNSIFNNTGTEMRVDLDGETLKAENNWWGVAGGLAPGERTLEDFSDIDADPFLTSAP